MWWRVESGRESKNFWRRLDWRSSRARVGWMGMGTENVTMDGRDGTDFQGYAPLRGLRPGNIFIRLVVWAAEPILLQLTFSDGLCS